MQGGSYGNTSKDRIKDTLSKAQFLLDDPFTGGDALGSLGGIGGANKDLYGLGPTSSGPSGNIGGGFNDYRGSVASVNGLAMAKG